MNFDKIGATLKATGNGIRSAVVGSWAWIRACPPDMLGGIGRSIVNVAVVIIGFVVIARIAAATGYPLALAHYGIVGVAAAISTITTSLLLLGDRPTKERQRGGRRELHDPGRFWLMCFALVAIVALLVNLIARLPDKLAPPWTTAEKGLNGLCQHKAGVQPKAGC
jgi:hypothetical protein